MRVYGATVSKDTISRITDKVCEEMTAWAQRPLDAVYPVVLVDAIHVKVGVWRTPRDRMLAGSACLRSPGHLTEHDHLM